MQRPKPLLIIVYNLLFKQKKSFKNRFWEIVSQCRGIVIGEPQSLRLLEILFEIVIIE